jgi:asparagine synthase (glutamine-hydrolysing)
MARFIIIVDRSSTIDLDAAIEEAREALTHGGGHEHAFRLVESPCAVLVLSHDERSPFGEDGATAKTDDAGLTLRFGVTPAGVERVLAGASGPTASTAGVTAGAGARMLVRWARESNELALVTDPNGQLPVYFHHADGLTIIASELKAIWAVRRSHLTADATAFADLLTLGYCLAERTHWREISCAGPGAVYRFGGGEVERSDYHQTSFSDHSGASSGELLRTLNATMRDVLEGYRASHPRVTIALSGGMDSRYVLAVAREVWSDLESFTFGQAENVDRPLAGELARRAGIPNRVFSIEQDYLSSWGPYAIWRTDGMVSCLRALGIDACIEQSREHRFVLNGIGGDFLLGGARVRPPQFRSGATPSELAQMVMAIGALHSRPLDTMLKPELHAAIEATPLDTLEELLGRYSHTRNGNNLLCFWLRHYCARSTTMGLVLEAPFVEHLGPLVDPAFVEAASALSLEDRFMARGFRKALAMIAPEFMSVPWPRFRLAPRAPWPLLMLGRLSLQKGPFRREEVFLVRDHLPWIKGLLLDGETASHGYFLPAYLEEIVGLYERGDASIENEIGMAVSLELWRRIFVEGRTELAQPPGSESIQS